MVKIATDQRRIHGNYNQKKGANLGRKLENQRIRAQGGAKETRREDDGNDKYKHASFLQ